MPPSDMSTTSSSRRHYADAVAKSMDFNWQPLSYVHRIRLDASNPITELALVGNCRARRALNDELLREYDLCDEVAILDRYTSNWFFRPLPELMDPLRRIGLALVRKTATSVVDAAGVRKVNRLLGVNGRREAILDERSFLGLSAWGATLNNLLDAHDAVQLGGSVLLSMNADLSESFCRRYELKFSTCMLRLGRPPETAIDDARAILDVTSDL
jgi:YOP proteins translocation protein K (YscK)